MSGSVLLSALAVGAAVLAASARPVPVLPRPDRRPAQPTTRRWRRPVVAAASGVGVWVVLGGTVGVAAGVVAAVVSARVLATAEPPSVRRDRERATRDLPHLVDLFAATLHAGADPADGLAQVAHALPGPAAERLRPVIARAAMGASPGEAWAGIAGDDVLAPLGRALLRSHRTGASVVQAVERLADELEREQQASAEDRARRVGVIAAIPLGVCLLPAFLLIGIVPTVASMLAAIAP